MNKEKEAKERTINTSPKTPKLKSNDKEGYEVKIKEEKPKLKLARDEKVEVKADIVKIKDDGKKDDSTKKTDVVVKLEYDNGSWFSERYKITHVDGQEMKDGSATVGVKGFFAGWKWPFWVMWAIIALLAGLAIWFFVSRQKKSEEEEEL